MKEIKVWAVVDKNSNDLEYSVAFIGNVPFQFKNVFKSRDEARAYKCRYALKTGKVVKCKVVNEE